MKALLQEIKQNFATTKIPLYDTAGAHDDDWKRANDLLDTVDWIKELQDKTEIEAAIIIIKELEKVVMKTMHKKEAFKNEHKCDENEAEREENQHKAKHFRSKNTIPRQVRTQMKREKRSF